MDIADVLIPLNGFTILAVLAVGTLTGGLFFRDGRTQRPVLYRMVTLGVVFLATLATSRWSQGSDTWEAYIGVALLWLIFTVGAAAGSWIGKRIRLPAGRR